MKGLQGHLTATEREREDLRERLGDSEAMVGDNIPGKEGN